MTGNSRRCWKKFRRAGDGDPDERQFVRREYARLFDRLVPDERGAVQAYLAELSIMTVQIADARNFLDHPSIPDAEKLKVLRATAPQKFTELVWRVFGDIMKRRIVDLLPAIASEMERLAAEARNIRPVSVTGAVALSEFRKETLSEKLSVYLGAGVKMDYSVDPSLLSGFLVKIGDIVLDNSIRSDLENLGRKLLATPPPKDKDEAWQ